jgi:uncharacterized protein with ParB-like and HNH nuclease domain
MALKKLDEISLEKLRTKAKERTVRTQNIEYTPEMIIKRVKSGEIKLSPDYQRNHRWDNKTSSRLIESMILNIPIPLIYLSQDIDLDDETGEGISRYSIIDGQQRLTAICNFFTNQFPLTKLETFKELNGYHFKDLPDFLIRRLEDRGIKFLRIDSTLDPELKYYIFEKLNRGSVNLEPQELRNSIYRGEFNNLLKKLAKYENFRKLLKIKDDKNSKVKKMEDIELVLRFFAFGLENNYINYKNIGLEVFLSNYMESMNKRVKKTPILLDTLEKDFYNVMDFIYRNFQDKAFVKYNPTKISAFNKAVFDALAVSIYIDVDLKNNSITKEFKDDYKKLFSEDKRFMKSIDGAVASATKVKDRINTLRELLNKHNVSK